MCWPGAFSNNRISPKFTNESKEEENSIDEIEEKFVTMNSFIDLKEQFSEIKDKIDKIYDLLIDLK